VADPGGNQANEEPAQPAGPAAELHWLTLRFPDAGLEQDFRREQAAKSVVPFRTSVLVGVLLYAFTHLICPDCLHQFEERQP
jgi:hypothetical protein